MLVTNTVGLVFLLCFPEQVSKELLVEHACRDISTCLALFCTWNSNRVNTEGTILGGRGWRLDGKRAT